jgi:hypothetical protein
VQKVGRTRDMMNDASRQAKADELLAFLEESAGRLRMNVPASSAVRETVDSLLEKEESWPNDMSAEKFARVMVRRYPELRFEWTGNTEGEAGPDEAATDKQIAYLRVLEAPIERYLSVREASDLIDRYRNRVSEGQKRRLKFYGLSYAPEITREDATELIDRYKSEHPESEAAYQAWKASQGGATER